MHNYMTSYIENAMDITPLLKLEGLMGISGTPTRAVSPFPNRLFFFSAHPGHAHHQANSRRYESHIFVPQEIHRTDTTSMNNTLRRQYRQYTKTGADIYHSAGIGLKAEISADRLFID